MESKNKKPSKDNNFHFYRYNSTKVKPNLNNNINNVNKEFNNNGKNNEISNTKIKNDNEYKKFHFINENNLNNKNIPINFNDNNIINKVDNNINKINELSPTQEQIIKLKRENEELRKHVDKRGKLIIDLKDRCNEQKTMINELVKKIENIKKFIPENAFKKDKERQKEKDKLEEQLAIAAVEEQIIKELCPENSNQATMDQIFNEKNDDKQKNIIKDKIMKIPQIYYKSNKYINCECSICFDQFKENEMLKQLPCEHIFHKECLGQWFLNMNNCPFCNQIC